MDYKEFESKLKKINEKLFEDYADGVSLGTFTYANISGKQRSILILNINPNPPVSKETDENNSSESHSRSVHPLVYIPACDRKNLYENFSQELLDCFNEKIIWHARGFYSRPYRLFDDKVVKMFWATDEAYKEEIGNVYPEVKTAWEKCFDNEAEKQTDYILVFADLFYQCERSQKELIKHLTSFEKENLTRAERRKAKEKVKNELGENVKKIMELYMEYYNPELIVVTNRGASKLIKSAYIAYADDQLKDEIDIPYDGRTVKCLFTSMLTGRGRLSNELYDRLKWRINDLLKNSAK